MDEGNRLDTVRVDDSSRWGDSVGRAARRAREPGRWRRSEHKRLDHPSASANGYGSFYDALARLGWPRWALSLACFVAGVAWLVVPWIGHRDGGFDRPLGWLAYGLVGLALLMGFWMASLPYAGSPIAVRLRVLGVVGFLVPTILHGWDAI